MNLALDDSYLAFLLAHIGQNYALKIESTHIGLGRLIYSEQWFEGILELGKQIARKFILFVRQITVIV